MARAASTAAAGLLLLLLPLLPRRFESGAAPAVSKLPPSSLCTLVLVLFLLLDERGIPAARLDESRGVTRGDGDGERDLFPAVLVRGAKDAAAKRFVVLSAPPGPALRGAKPPPTLSALPTPTTPPPTPANAAGAAVVVTPAADVATLIAVSVDGADASAASVLND